MTLVTSICLDVVCVVGQTLTVSCVIVCVFLTAITYIIRYASFTFWIYTRVTILSSNTATFTVFTTGLA